MLFADFFRKFFHESHQSVKYFLDPDQARHYIYVGPDLGLNCLQMLLDETTQAGKK